MPRKLYLHRSSENVDANRISGERYASVYNLDYRDASSCGYCVEASRPMHHARSRFELGTYDINSLVYRKEQLLK